MEVTRSNFVDALPSIQKAIEQADFISIDCELTGLHTVNDVNAFDTQQQFYTKTRRSTKDFLTIQYGLGIFRYDKDKKTFKQQGYNFYIFPRPTNRDIPDHRFLCQASSIDFLISKGFDFNKLFKEGISYLNCVEEEKFRNALLEKQKLRANQLKNGYSPQNDKHNNITLSDEETVLIKGIVQEVEVFLQGDKTEKILPRQSAYIRKLVYQELPKHFKNKLQIETKTLENKDRVLVVKRFKSKEEQEKEEQSKISSEEAELKLCIGKLVVGHNMCLDLLHTIDKFLSPLPMDYSEFKELANYSFANILDTKYMASAPPLKDLISSNVLPHLVETVNRSPFVIPPIEIEENAEGYDLKDPKEHEAGYDAYITGLCFMAMWNYLGTLEEANCDPFTDFSLLNPYKNRLHLMRLYEAPYIFLGGNDPVGNKDHVLYITFPKEWKLNDILQLFSPFGNVYVAWIDDRSAYVALQKRDQTALALSTLSQSDTYTVMPYAKRQAQLGDRMVLPSSPHPARRKRSGEGLNNLRVKRRSLGAGEEAQQRNGISHLSSKSPKRHRKPIFAEIIIQV